jgi:hypothetical protein
MVSPGAVRHRKEEKVCARNSKGKTVRRKRATETYKMELITILVRIVLYEGWALSGPLQRDHR